MNERYAYMREARDYIGSMKNAVIILGKKPKNKEALHEIIKCSHDLKGNAMQTGSFLVAYFSHMINDIARDIEEGRIKPTEENIVFINDFLGSLEKILGFTEKKKRYEISRQLFQKLDKIMRDEFTKPIKKDVKELYEEEVGARLDKIDSLMKDLRTGFDAKTIKSIISELHTLEGIFLQAEFLRNSSICLITKDIMYKLLENRRIDSESVAIIKNSMKRLRKSLKSLRGR